MMMVRGWVRSENNECQIDSIAQSWAVLSGAADDSRHTGGTGHGIRQQVAGEARLNS